VFPKLINLFKAEREREREREREMRIPMRPQIRSRLWMLWLFFLFFSQPAKPSRARVRSQFARMFSVDKRYRERSGSFDARPITFAPGT